MDHAGDDARDVIRRELELLDPAIRRDPDAVRERLHPAFRELGASGRVWELESMLASLAGAVDEQPAVAHELEPVRLADDLILLTYLAERAGCRSRRSSIWERVDGSWRLRFHQGTPVS
jgi:ribonuclease HI